MKFTKENGVFEENVFSNIRSTHKNAPKKYSPILKFQKKKNMTCPNDELGNEHVMDYAVSDTSRPLKDKVLELLFPQYRLDMSQMLRRNLTILMDPVIAQS